MTQLVKNVPAMWETWFDPCVVKSPWRRERLPTPHSDLENFTGCIVHGVAKSQTLLSNFHSLIVYNVLGEFPTLSGIIV